MHEFLGKEIKVNPDWKKFFEREDIKKCIGCIESQIKERIKNGEIITPDPKSKNKDVNVFKIFRKLSTKNIKVVILGQDPYPKKGAATGRAFEVGKIKEYDKLISWKQPFGCHSSLCNLLKLLIDSLIFYLYCNFYIILQLQYCNLIKL